MQVLFQLNPSLRTGEICLAADKGGFDFTEAVRLRFYVSKARISPCKARKLACLAAAPFPRKAIALRGPCGYRKPGVSQVRIPAQGSHVGTSYARSDFYFLKVTRCMVPPFFAKGQICIGEWLAAAPSFLREQKICKLSGFLRMVKLFFYLVSLASVCYTT